MVTSDSLLVPLGLGLAAWVLFSHLAGLWERLRHKRGLKAIAADMGSGGRSYYGMLLAHLGIAMFIVGATMVSNFGSEKDVRMSPGDVHEAAGYRFQFEGVETVPGPNYRAAEGAFLVFRAKSRSQSWSPRSAPTSSAQNP